MSKLFNIRHQNSNKKSRTQWRTKSENLKRTDSDGERLSIRLGTQRDCCKVSVSATMFWLTVIITKNRTPKKKRLIDRRLNSSSSSSSSSKLEIYRERESGLKNIVELGFGIYVCISARVVMGTQHGLWFSYEISASKADLLICPWLNIFNCRFIVPPIKCAK